MWTRVAPRTAVGRAVPVLSTPVPHILSQTTLSQTTLSHPISDHRPHTRILPLTQTIGHTRPHILRISELRAQSSSYLKPQANAAMGGKLYSGGYTKGNFAFVGVTDGADVNPVPSATL